MISIDTAKERESGHITTAAASTMGKQLSAIIFLKFFRQKNPVIEASIHRTRVRGVEGFRKETTLVPKHTLAELAVIADLCVRACVRVSFPVLEFLIFDYRSVTAAAASPVWLGFGPQG